MKHGYKTGMAAIALLMPTLADAGETTLKSVMQQLGQDFSALNHAVLLEDFDGIRGFSLKIADHPKPGMMERLSILAKVGTDSGKFKQFDGEVHEAAKAVHAAAEQEDMGTVMTAQARLFNGCMQCHASFRKTVASGN